MTEVTRLILMGAISIILVALALIALSTRPAGSAGACLTRAEARQLFPGKWLYWHTKHRCWDATPTRPEKPVRRIVHLKRPIPQEAPVQIIRAAPAFTPWDARIGIPTKP